MTTIWLLTVTLGPLLLLAVLIWAWLRNRRTPPSVTARSERGARELREEIKRDPEYRES
jgi:hypothetical protein